HHGGTPGATFVQEYHTIPGRAACPGRRDSTGLDRVDGAPRDGYDEAIGEAEAETGLAEIDRAHRERGRIVKRTIAVTLATTAWTAPPPAPAEHAKITLDVSAPGGKQTAYMDQTPPDWGKNPRPVLKARVGDPIKIQWMFVNIYPHKTLEN